MKNKVKMTMEILDIIHATLDYKKFICSQNRLNQFHNDKFNWYSETEKYYYALDLPEGMNHNRVDFEKILLYMTKKGMIKLDKMDNTEPEDLSEFEW